MLLPLHFFLGPKPGLRAVSEWVALDPRHSLEVSSPSRPSFPKSFSAKHLEGEQGMASTGPSRLLGQGSKVNQDFPGLPPLPPAWGPLSTLEIGVGRKVPGTAGSPGCGPRALSPSCPNAGQKSGLPHSLRAQQGLSDLVCRLTLAHPGPGTQDSPP